MCSILEWAATGGCRHCFGPRFEQQRFELGLQRESSEWDDFRLSRPLKSDSPNTVHQASSDAGVADSAPVEAAESVAAQLQDYCCSSTPESVDAAAGKLADAAVGVFGVVAAVAAAVAAIEVADVAVADIVLAAVAPIVAVTAAAAAVRTLVAAFAQHLSFLA